jgi:uncharacterized protein YcaQ
VPRYTRAGKSGHEAIALSPRDAARIAYIASFGPGCREGYGPGETVPAPAPPAVAHAAHQAAEPAAQAAHQAAESAAQAAHQAAESAAQAAALLSRLGYVQIDTISVVERAHHHALWSRLASYSPPLLDELQGEPRLAFEYWAHAAAYLPIEDYRYCLPRMRRIAEEGHEWFPHDARMVDWVLDRIKAEGPLRSQDFESEGARGPWWDWKPAKSALEYLFHSGRLMVKARPGFQKLYELRERVLPATVDTSFPNDEDMADWYLRRAASALGVFSVRDLAYNRKDGTKLLSEALERASEAGSLLPAHIVAAPGAAGGKGAGSKGGGAEAKEEPCWLAPASYEALDAWTSIAYAADGGPILDAGARAIRILSPFDNFIIDRKRSLRLLGHDYTLECYVPAAKRRFGYFSLPVFLYERPIGLLDCKADRKTSRLIIRRCELGDGEDSRAVTGTRSLPKAYKGAFLDELKAFAAFNDCSESEWHA